MPHYCKYKNNLENVRQTDVRQKVKVSFWVDPDDYSEIENITKDNANFLNKKPNISKTFQDIISDFALDQKTQRQQKELEGI